MKNVYDIKKDKNLNFILPKKKNLDNSKQYMPERKIAIIIHLHYLDTIRKYIKYIENIPLDMDMFFTFSDSRIKEILLQTKVGRRNNYKFIEKQNRGRDISAFLVACRKNIINYEYICFVHDKKEKKQIYKEDTEKWIQCLWENMLGSTEYIENIITTFYENPQLGLLVPPTPLSAHFSMAITNTWSTNFPIAELLVDKMHLNCNLDYSKPPITIGTVYWARVQALRKLFDIEWKYEDFDEEPLEENGTISHAIERIFAYVAQDTGFETGWVMTDEYAGERFEYIYQSLQKAFEKLGESLDIRCIEELYGYERKSQELMVFINKYKKIYIYGAGMLGKSCLFMINKEQKVPDAFIVSDINQNQKEIQGIAVCSLEQIELNEYCGVIIGVGKKYQNEVLEKIKERNPNFSNIYFYRKY